MDGREDHLIRDDILQEIDTNEIEDEDSASLDNDMDELEFFSDSDQLMCVPYSGKIWPALNLANWSQRRIGKF